MIIGYKIISFLLRKKKQRIKRGKLDTKQFAF